MKKLIIFSFLILVSTITHAQIEKFQALFMYKFLQNFEWSATKVENGYKVGVLGNDAVYNELSKMVAGRSVSGKQVEVIKYTPGTSTSDLHLIFISNRSKDLFESVNKTALATSTVVITETPGYAKKGAPVNFVTSGGSLKFELNEASLSQANVKASSSIKALAILVK